MIKIKDTVTKQMQTRLSYIALCNKANANPAILHMQMQTRLRISGKRESNRRFIFKNLS